MNDYDVIVIGGAPGEQLHRCAVPKVACVSHGECVLEL